MALSPGRPGAGVEAAGERKANGYDVGHEMLGGQEYVPGLCWSGCPAGPLGSDSQWQLLTTFYPPGGPWGMVILRGPASRRPPEQLCPPPVEFRGKQTR